MSLKLEFHESPKAEDVAVLNNGLIDHMRAILAQPGLQQVAFFHRLTDNLIAGGIAGYINWNWAFVQSFWVAEELRHNQLGSILLDAFEKYAKGKGCEHIHLDTFSFQAPAFYEKHGFSVFAELDDYPQGHKRIFYKKALV